MPIEAASLLDTSHFAAFLGGAAIGAAGQYLADRFTDLRRKKEQHQHLDAAFSEAMQRSPVLLSEMRADVQGTGNEFMHEFVVLPSRNVMYSPEKNRFGYFESDHKDLLNQVSLLVVSGLVVQVREGTPSVPPAFRFSSEFLARLKSAA